MSILSPMLAAMGKSVTWRSLVSKDTYGDPTFTDSTITVVWFDSRRVLHREGREDIICDAYCLTDSVVHENDSIIKDGEEWPVQNVDFTEGPGGVSLRVVNMSSNKV